MPALLAKDYRDRLQHDWWFTTLPRAMADQMLDAAIVRSFKDKQCVFARGDAPCGLYCIVGGSVRVTGVTEAGKEALLACLDPITWFGEICLFDNLPRTHDAYAQGATVMLQVQQQRMLEILSASPEHWRMLGMLMAVKLRLTFIGMEDLALLPAPQRLARRLLLIAENAMQRDAANCHIEIQQEQLAMMLSLSRQTANQILKDLEAQGIVRLAYGRIDILDMPRMRQVARLSEHERTVLPHVGGSV